MKSVEAPFSQLSLSGGTVWPPCSTESSRVRGSGSIGRNGSALIYIIYRTPRHGEGGGDKPKEPGLCSYNWFSEVPSGVSLMPLGLLSNPLMLP